MPLPRRGGEPRLAGARVVRTSLPRATPRSPKRVGRGAPLLSHAQRLTRRRHSSEQVPPEPEHADFRSGKWLQERAGGDARDLRHTPLARMGSRQRSVSTVPLGRAFPAAAMSGSPVVASNRVHGSCLPTRRLPRAGTHLESTASQPPCSHRHPDAIGPGLGAGLIRGRL